MLERTYIEDVTDESDGKHTTIAGHVHDRRDLGGVVFLVVRDRTGTMQVVAKEETPVGPDRIRDLGREDVVQVQSTQTNREPHTSPANCDARSLRSLRFSSLAWNDSRP